MTVHGQTTRRQVVEVTLGEIRIDEVIGVDSAFRVHLRTVIENDLRRAGLLARAVGDTIPLLAMNVFVPRMASGHVTTQLMIALEVGRNLVENGHRRTLIWSRSFTGPEYPSYAALRENLIEEIREQIREYTTSGAAAAGSGRTKG
jgi:hypothetical protein